MNPCARRSEACFDRSVSRSRRSARPRSFCAASFPPWQAAAWSPSECRGGAGVRGLDFQAELAKANIHTPVIFMTGHGDIPMSVQAMKAGAVDFLTKPFRDQDMLDAVATAIERDRSRRKDEQRLSDVRARFDGLTEREREVMGFVTAGLMNKQIAGELGLSEITVKIHRGHVMRKMAARSLADLVRMAEALGVRRSKPESR